MLMRPKNGTSWQPSNGNEGMEFMAEYCDRCHYELGARQCPIIVKTMALDPQDDGYPKEWVYRDGWGHCTKFKKPERVCHEKNYQDKNQLQLFKKRGVMRCDN
jgi:hypothetical protein